MCKDPPPPWSHSSLMRLHDLLIRHLLMCKVVGPPEGFWGESDAPRHGRFLMSERKVRQAQDAMRQQCTKNIAVSTASGACAAAPVHVSTRRSAWLPARLPARLAGWLAGWLPCASPEPRVGRCCRAYLNAAAARAPRMTVRSRRGRYLDVRCLDGRCRLRLHLRHWWRELQRARAPPLILCARVRAAEGASAAGARLDAHVHPTA